MGSIDARGGLAKAGSESFRIRSRGGPPCPPVDSGSRGSPRRIIIVIMLKGLIITLRPHQWVKNLFVIAPLVFSRELFDWQPALLSVVAFFIFCFLAGAVYALNDLIDAERDRAHPVKRNRPIASGKVPPAVAASMSAALTAGSLVGGAFVSPEFAAVCAAYLILNVAYSFKLKHWPYVDVLCIALGFLFRILAGSYAAGVAASNWLLVCTFLLALFLALGKRKQEMARTEGTRPVLDLYNPAVVTWAMRVCAVLTLAAYAGYTLDPHTQEMFGTALLPIGIPFAAVGVFRFLNIVNRSTESGHSPTEEMLRDLPFVTTVILWSALNVYFIYWT